MGKLRLVKQMQFPKASHASRGLPTGLRACSPTHSLKGAFYTDKAHRGLCAQRPNKNTRGTTSGALLSIKGLEVSSFPPQATPEPRSPGRIAELTWPHTGDPGHALSLAPACSETPGSHPPAPRSRAMFLGRGNALDLTAPRAMQATSLHRGLTEAACRPRAALHPEPSACWHESTVVTPANPGARLQAEATS